MLTGKSTSLQPHTTTLWYCQEKIMKIGTKIGKKYSIKALEFKDNFPEVKYSEANFLKGIVSIYVEFEKNRKNRKKTGK